MKNCVYPVPAVHLQSAIDTFSRAGAVQFGTDNWQGAHDAQDAIVWIYASSTGSSDSPVPGWSIGHVVAKGRLRRVVEAIEVDLEKRPASTATDTKWSSFVELEDFEKLENPILISAFGLKSPPRTFINVIPPK